MTVNTLNITSGPYTGNGLSDTYSYDFTVQDKTQLSIYETDDNGSQTLLVVDTDYTVNNVGSDGGDTITRLAGNLPTDYQWYIRSNYIANQLTDFPSQGAFFPDIHEKQFDHLTFLIQQSIDVSSRQFSLSSSIPVDGVFTISDVAADRAGKFQGFDAAGNSVLLSGTGADAALRIDIASSDVTKGSALVAQSVQVINSKAIAKTVQPNATKSLLIKGDDGGLFKSVLNAAPGTYADNGGSFCGTQFIPNGGDGSAAWIRENFSDMHGVWFGLVYDGVTDNTLEHQNLLNEASLVKVKVLHSAGTTIFDLKLDIPSNTHIVGAGMGVTVIKRKDASGIPLHGGIFNNANFDIANAHTLLDQNITIENITLDGNKANNPASHYGVFFTGVRDTRLLNVEVKNTTLQGVRLLGSDRTRVRDGYYHDTDANPIHLEDSFNYIIDGNFVKDSGDYGIEVTAGTLLGYSTSNSGNGTISNNNVDTCFVYGICVRGIKDAVTNPLNKSIRGAKIFGNNVKNSTTGICVQEFADLINIFDNDTYENVNGIGTAASSGTLSTRLNISNNNVYSNTENGIELDTAIASVVHGNNVFDNAFNGITGSLSSSRITDNIVQGNCTDGINIHSGIVVNFCEDALVSGNEINNPNELYSIFENTTGFCQRNSYISNDLHSGVLNHQSHFTYFSNPQASTQDNALIYNSNFISLIPTSSAFPGQIGDTASDANFKYTCYATNVWARVAHSAF